MRHRSFTTTTISHYHLLLCLLFWSAISNAQLTGHQTIVTKCFTGTTQNFNNTTGTFVGNVNFVAGVDIPVGHQVVDVMVEVVWSKTDDGSCTATTGIAPDLSHVGFQIRGPVGGTRHLAASALLGPFLSTPTTSSFIGTTNVIRDTTIFKDGYPSLLPASMPVPGPDTVAPNNDSLSFYCGQSPYGLWRVGAIDDAPSAGPHLCIHSYCITLTTCDPNYLLASCKANPSIGLNDVGVHSFEFSDLDSISDVSCLVKDITFSPSTVSCSDVGTNVPVTMTIRDHLNNVSVCSSSVTVLDTTKPSLNSCGPAVWGTKYLDVNGVDTFWADSVSATDNCLPIIKEVRPFVGGTWSPFLRFNCIRGLQQFWFRATDLSGNVDSCLIRVRFRDTFPPTAVCAVDTAFLTTSANGAVTVLASAVDGGSYDVCPPVIGRWIGSQFAPPPVYTCADIGEDTVSLIVADISGNLDTCHTARIIVVDRVAPVANCKPVTVYLDIAGNGILYTDSVNNNSTDVCGIDSMNINGSSTIMYDCSHVNATQSVTLNVFDESGNHDSCVAIITVKDTFPPLANCKNVTAYLDANGQATVYADSLNDNSVDLCTGTNLTFEIGGNAYTTYTCADIASNPNPITLTVIDSFGNASTCGAWAIIQDTLNPTANCTTPTVYLNDAGIATLFAADLSAGSTDNCAVTDSFVNTIGTDFITFDCSTIFAPQAVNLIVQDQQGNSATCSTTVNVVDSAAPMALCKGTFLAQLDLAGVVTVYPSDIDSNSTDNCGLVQYQINGYNSVQYSCTNLGIQVATLTVQDSSGNSSSCIAQVQIQDNTPPIVSCQTTTAYLNQSGLSNIVPNDVLVYPATNDNCGITSTAFATGTSMNYTCDSVGQRTVVVLVTDNQGNVSSCTTSVTVLDTIAPTASCRPVPFNLQLDSMGVGCITPLDIDNGSSDLCNLDTMLVNGLDSLCFSCSNLGSNLVTLSVLDSSGNQNTCVATVNVRDAIRPDARCKDTTIYLGATGTVSLLPAAIDNGSTDNCSFGLTINNQSSFIFNCTQVGGNAVQLTATDASGNVGQCAATVTVLDTVEPVANCIPPNSLSVYLDSSCFASIPASVLNSGSTDNCNLSTGAYSVGGLQNATFNASNIGNTTTVTLTVTDQGGNSATCATTILVLDTIAPVISCMDDTVQLDATGNVNIAPQSINVSAVDNCSNTNNYSINGQPSIDFTCVNIGQNTVTLVATDSSGNASSCSSNIVVEDLISPIANCNPTVTLNLDLGGSSGVLTTGMVDLSSTDNCGITMYSLSKDTFTCADITMNPHVITLFVEDASGNRDSCTTQVTVHDNTPPTASCQTATVYLGAGGMVTVDPTAVLVTPPTGDNCTTLTSTFSGQGNTITYTCDSIGANSVTVVVTDISGNTASCITSITVEDSTAPVANCVSTPYIVQLDSTGVGCVTPVNVNSGSVDFCGIDTMLVNGVDSLCYTCAHIGTTAVTLSVLDASGNLGTCVANIVINDPISPMADCHDTTLYLGATGVVTVTPALIDAGSSDNCSFTTTVNGVASLNYTCTQVGTNTVQLVVTDGSGNIAQCPANITVVDTLAPTANCATPGSTTVYLDNTCFASISAASLNSGSTDNCPSSLSYFVNGLPNATFNATHLTTNPNPIVLAVTDGSGNIATCSTTVIVSDTIRPTTSCQPDTVQLVGTTVMVSAAMINAGTSDNCSAPTLTINGQASVTFDCSALGNNIVTLVATDLSGNQDSCTTTVFVEDVAPPVASCKLTTVADLDPATNMVVLSVADLDNGSVDNCQIINYSFSQDTFDCNAIYTNPHPVTMTVLDQSGNLDSCITQVIIRDTIAPVALCRDDTLYFSGSPIILTPAAIDAGSYDNCALQRWEISQDTFDCPDIGVNNVTLTVTDSSGNSASCVAQVTVLDTTASAMAGSDQVLCMGDSTILTAAPATGSLMGAWTTSSGATIADSSAATTSITNIPVGTNVFYWTLFNSSCANLSRDSIIIDVVLPSPDTALAGVDLHLCGDTTVTLSGNTPQISTGIWMQDSTQAAANIVIADTMNPSTTIHGLMPGNTYTFVWQLTNSLCGVHSVDTIHVTIDSMPTDTAMAGPDITCSPQSLNLAAVPAQQGMGVWSTPTTATIDSITDPTTLVSTFVQDTTVFVWSLSNGACVDYSVDTMLVILGDVQPIANADSFNLIPDGTINTLHVIDNDSLPSTWNILIHTPMTEGQMANQNDGSFVIDINGVNFSQTFIYEVCNANCPTICDTALVRVAIQPPGACYTPNTFTPNGDGSNDYFVIPCLATTNEKGALYIFNRWGNLVFETDNYLSDWDGTHKNQPLPDGVYFYILQIEGKSPQQGSIEIKR